MDDLVFWNGIDGLSGRYLFEPSDVKKVEELARASRGSLTPPQPFRTLPSRQDMLARRDVVFGSPIRRTRQVRFGGLMNDVDPRSLAESGWGVILPDQGNPAVRDALRPLLALRREQAESRFRELSYRTGEKASDFLERHGVGPGPVDPDRLPYYLLLAGDPEEIPYDVQFQLGSQYAVGRLAFATPEEHARYAEGIIAQERGAVRRARSVALFGVRTSGDPATQASADHLVAPLAEALRRKADGWEIQTWIGPGAATKERLSLLLGGSDAPALVLTASHGLGFPCGSPLQAELQGALLCQDWPGPEEWPKGAPIPAEHCFAAADLEEEARPAGLILVEFACFGAGTPRLESFARREGREPLPLAQKPLVSRLPQRLLGHPGGTAAAVIGHVDRTWSTSFLWRRAGSQLQAFESALGALLRGHRVGWALDAFTLRRAQLAADLTEAVEQNGHGDALRLSSLWTAHNDARAFVILGDPAVRLAAAAS